jgi:hypothetical protein
MFAGLKFGVHLQREVMGRLVVDHGDEREEISV